MPNKNAAKLAALRSLADREGKLSGLRTPHSAWRRYYGRSMVRSIQIWVSRANIWRLDVGNLKSEIGSGQPNGSRTYLPASSF